MWNEWLSECRSLGIEFRPILSTMRPKLSAPEKANLNIVWHFPTHYNGRAMFGFTADPKNPCLVMQNHRIGPNPHVCTNGLIPFRANAARRDVYDKATTGVDWASLLPKSAQVIEKSAGMTMKLLSMSRVVILVGKHVYDIVKSKPLRTNSPAAINTSSNSSSPPTRVKVAPQQDAAQKADVETVLQTALGRQLGFSGNGRLLGLGIASEEEAIRDAKTLRKN